MATLKERQISKCQIYSYVFSTQLARDSTYVARTYTTFLTNFLTFIKIIIPDAIKQMLNLNQPITKGLAAEPVWKILIYDRVGQDIISPILPIRDLREMGITLHM